jgi:hypothetical protein
VPFSKQTFAAFVVLAFVLFWHRQVRRRCHHRLRCLFQLALLLGLLIVLAPLPLFLRPAPFSFFVRLRYPEVGFKADLFSGRIGEYVGDFWIVSLGSIFELVGAGYMYPEGVTRLYMCALHLILDLFDATWLRPIFCVRACVLMFCYCLLTWKAHAVHVLVFVWGACSFDLVGLCLRFCCWLLSHF